MTTTTTGPWCKHCNVALSRNHTGPCPSCGKTGKHWAVDVHATGLGVVDKISVTLIPGNQVRNWCQRWEEIELHLKRIAEPRQIELSRASITTARHDLHSFFIQAYHLKDALIQDASIIGVTKSEIESAITKSPILSLLADLANLDKHGKLDEKDGRHRGPRSGDVPKFGNASGTSAATSGWVLQLEIHHKGTVVDGVSFAAEAVESWRKQLVSWGLL